jgi:predicted AlkP superfamily phosphohydrolase/phosphomutase
MRYLRMLSNSIVGAAVAVAYLEVLILLLNPELSLQPATLWPLFTSLATLYGPAFGVLFYVLMVLRQLIAFEPRPPSWVSAGVITWLSTIAASTAAALMWLNRRTFSPMLLEDTTRRLTTAAAWLSACAALFLVLAFVHYSFGRRGGRVAGTLVVLTLVASLSLPLAARGARVPMPGSPYRAAVAPALVTSAPRSRVVVILLDGASLGFISDAAAGGRLPNFGRILDGGAAMHLSTLRPTQPGPVWAAVATGKLPAKNGVRSAARYRARGGERFEVLPDFCFSHALVRFGAVTEEPNTSASLRARPVWDILSGLGISVGVAGWPLSHPVQPVRGYLVSDQLHQATQLSLGTDNSAAVYPAEAVGLTRSAIETVQAGAATGIAAASTLNQVPVLRDLVSTDAIYEQVWTQLRVMFRPQMEAVRYRGLDTAGHRYLRYAMPAAFGDVTDEERRAYGQVLVSAYSIIDAAVGRALALLGPDDLLLVVSGFGMEPLGLGKRVLERMLGDDALSGTHENAPEGFMLAYGGAVEPGRGRRLRGAVVDVAPTILYFFGLPVARDMDGYARADILKREFTENRPITFIPTYER